MSLSDGSKTPPPASISGGKRLNFDRQEPYGSWDAPLTDTFYGYGKDDGCTPSASWDELCAFAELIVNHPAFIPNACAGVTYHPPSIEEAGQC